MRKARALLIAGIGAWLGWRLRGSLSSLEGYRGVGPSGATTEDVAPLAERINPAEAMDKARAIVELGRERGRDLLRQLLGGRAA